MRLGLAGGGTDVAPYSDIYGGLVLNATINLYAYCTIEELPTPEIIIEAYDADCIQTLPLKPQLEIDGKGILVKGVYNRLVRDYGISTVGFRITTYNDAPIGSGLGTSSAMVVAILKSFIEWKSLPLGDYETSRLAFEIERQDLQLAGGKQDQYAAAFGGFNYMEFHKDNLVIINPLKIKRWIVDELEGSILLYFTGRSRSSARIIDEQKKNAEQGHREAIEAMHAIKESAIHMKHALLKGDMHELARILGKAWEDKKKMAGAISNPMIQEAFDVAMANGAMAGKVSGAGGGGFIMFMVDPVKKKLVADALAKLPGFVMPFQFTEGGAHGWKIYDTDKI